MIKEVEKFLNGEDVEDSIHEKMFENKYFELLTSKICYESHFVEINRIYWLSAIIYRLTLTKYFQDLTTEENITLKKENLIIYIPFLMLSSELCKLLKSKYLYTSLLSTIARQMIEQICIIKEIENENIPEYKIVEAMIQSHNIHVGAKPIEIDDLNEGNKGILKVFNTHRSYGKLAKKYGYSFMYHLYSGDIHHISTIDKLMPQDKKIYNQYNNIYIKCLLSLTKESLLFINDLCNELTKEEIEKINSIEYIDLS